MLFVCFLMALPTFAAVSECREKYCEVCADHTMCIYKGPGCKLRSRGVTSKEKQIILGEHNKYRSVIANGTMLPQPPASNMFQLEWDTALEEVAQRWADQCTFGHDMCRDDYRFPVGQNVYMTIGSAEISWKECVAEWFREVKIWNPAFIDSFRFSKRTAHYTQLVWAKTMFVGCGRTGYGRRQLYVCNYGPAGNVIGAHVYLRGTPCSRCEAPSTCASSLCSHNTDCDILLH